MASPLSGSLAKTIHKASKNIFLDATLTRDVVASGGNPADPPAPTPVNYPCKAMRDNYSAFDKMNSSIATGDFKILILVNSLAVMPISNDIITIQGASSSIIKTDVDPANAVWVCQAKQ